jgi:hypothetical protein
MPVQNKTPADSGRNSLTAHVWQIRKFLSKSSDKPKKDFWDKADIAIKGSIALVAALGAVIIPVVVAIIGGRIQETLTRQTGNIQESIAVQNTGKDYLSLALGILEQKDLPEDMKKNTGLRKWAVALLQHYSPEPLDSETTTKLISGETTIPAARNDYLKSLDVSKITPGSEVHLDVRRTIGSVSFFPGLIVVDDPQVQESRFLHTSIDHPIDAIFSPDDHYVVVYDKDRFSICDLGQQPPNDKTRKFITEEIIVVKPFFEIQSIKFEANDAIVVTNLNGKETRYDLKGKVVQ